MEFTSRDLAENKIITFPSIDRCIYCSRTAQENAPERFSDEHVVPYGLTGNTLIFRRASCENCRKAIHGYETRILKSLLGRFREKIDAPTRNPKDRKPTQRLEFRRFGPSGEMIGDPIFREVLQEDAPTSFVSLELSPPIILEGPPKDGFVSRPWTYVDNKVVETLIRQIKEDTSDASPLGYKVGHVNERDLLRFLAKIAHGCALGVFGYGSFRPFLVEGILGGLADLRQFVGGWPPINENNASNAFEISLGATTNHEKRIVVAHIRLYGMLGAPAFIVAVGESFTDELPILHRFA